MLLYVLININKKSLENAIFVKNSRKNDCERCSVVFFVRINVIFKHLRKKKLLR